MQKALVRGHWLWLNKVLYTNRTGQQKEWEFVSRPQKSTDGVMVLTQLGEKILVVSVFRYPVGKFVLEFPAGMMDKGTPEETAVRELREETGYTLDYLELGRNVYNDPWKSTESHYFVSAVVSSDPQSQKLDPAESINVHLLKKSNFLEELLELKRKQNYEIDSRLYFFALGLQFK